MNKTLILVASLAAFAAGCSDDSATVGEHPSGRGHGPMRRGAPGSASSHLGEVNVELLGSEYRELSSAVLLNRWRELEGEGPGEVGIPVITSNRINTPEVAEAVLAEGCAEIRGVDPELYHVAQTFFG